MAVWERKKWRTKAHKLAGKKLNRNENRNFDVLKLLV
jgi:hypothetical protein